MSNDLDFIDLVEQARPEQPAAPPRSARRPAFDDGLAGATRRQAARATGRKHRTHGSYVQVTFRLPEEAVARIDDMARAAGVTKEDMKRWLVLQGLRAWEAGERPALEEEVVRQVARLDW